MSVTTAHLPDDAGTAETVAVIGMACRFPGGLDTPEDFWEFLTSGGVAVGDVPAERWDTYARSGAENAAVLRKATRRGCFLPDAAGFDASFFGVTPREAELMDPQQRVVLETTWEALEHAGIPPRSLAGSDTGVYMGVNSDDYGRQMLEDLPRIEAWTGIGASLCAIANRVSYVFDLHGPSYSVDAACASSSVTIHSACAGLRARECGVAVAGGVNIIAGPGLTVVLDAAQALSPHGRSRPFDAEADGYGRGEGAGVVVLKRLADARRDGDRVLAVIRGSAVHQDGRTNGIMSPNGTAQESVIRAALRQGGVAPETVDYVEAHGTGTRAGDPVEAAALSAVFGAGRSAGSPCLVGSVKGNIGHLEAAAGVAGVIKAVLALRHGEIPPQASFSTPNPAIPWAASGLRVATGHSPWPQNDRVRRAGVSSFGYGGTVAHTVLEAAHEHVTATDDERPERRNGPRVFPLSGASASAVRDYAERLAEAVGDRPHPPDAADVLHTLWQRRSHLPERAAVVASDTASLRYELRMLASGQPSPGALSGSAPHGEPVSAVWVFSGHGSHWAGMGGELLKTDSAFAEAIAVIDPIYREEMGYSPEEALADGNLGGVDRIQSLLFAMHVGLAASWRARGLRPAAVIGHSVGEVAASVAAGVFSLEDGARLICRRSNLLRRVEGAGAMAMVELPFRDVEARLGQEGAASAALEPSPETTVVAGTPEAVREFRARCTEEGIPARKVRSDVAFHTSQMDPLLKELRDALGGLSPQAPATDLYTTALDDPRTGAARDADYWAGNLRNPVRFAKAVHAAAEDGHRVFLELSPHPVVTHSIIGTLDASGVQGHFVTGSLRREEPEQEMLARNLAELYCRGVGIDTAVQGAEGGLAALPPTAWQHEHYWREASGAGWGAGTHDPDSASLLGAPLTIADPAAPAAWRTRVNYGSRPYPGAHTVQGTELVPASVLLTTMFEAVRDRVLEDVRFLTPMALEGPLDVQVVEREGALRIASKPTTGEDRGVSAWSTHTTASTAHASPPAGTVDLDAVRARCDREFAPEAVLERLSEIGISGTGLEWTIEELRGGDGELLALVRAGTDDGDAVAWARLLDCVTSAASLVLPGEPALHLLSQIRRIVVAGAAPERTLIHVVRPQGSEDGAAQAFVADEAGRVLASLEGLVLLPVEGAAAKRTADSLVHRVDWRTVGEAGSARPRTLVLVGGDGERAEAARGRAAAEGVAVRIAEDAESLAALAEGSALDGRDAVVVLGAAEPARARSGSSTASAAESGAWALARTAQALAALDHPHPPRLWCATTGVRECVDSAALAQSSMWGVGRIIGGEHPDLWGGIVDLPGGAPDSDAAALLSAVAGGGTGELLSFREDALQAARLVPDETEPTRPPLRCRADGTYLVTGGLGALGVQIAEWLIGRGARRLVLVGRSALPPRNRWDGPLDAETERRIAAIRRLEGMGATVRTAAADAADAASLERLLAPEELDLPPIRGVVHAAGVLDDRLLRDLDRDSLHTVMGPKAEGALALHRVLPPERLDFTAYFSSFGQFLNLPGQASYAAANSFLDGLARHHRSQGCGTVVSLCWTSWQDTGMAVNEVVEQQLRDAGVGRVSADEAFLSWEYAAQRSTPEVCVFPTLEREVGTPALPVLSELSFAPAGEDLANTAAELDFTGLDAAEMREMLLAEVTRQVAEEIRIAPEKLDPETSFTTLGVDSVLTLAIRRRLDRRFRMSLSATLLWSRPTVTGITDYLLERLLPGNDTPVRAD